jgi:hypothetical protein
MPLPLAASLERRVIAGFLVDFEVVSDVFDARHPLNATQNVINLGFKYWTAQGYVAVFRCHFDRARMRDYSAKFGPHAISEHTVIYFMRSECRLNRCGYPARAVIEVAPGDPHAVSSLPLSPNKLVAHKRASSLPSIRIEEIHHHRSNSQARAKSQFFIHCFYPLSFPFHLNSKTSTYCCCNEQYRQCPTHFSLSSWGSRPMVLGNR